MTAPNTSSPKAAPAATRVGPAIALATTGTPDQAVRPWRAATQPEGDSLDSLWHHLWHTTPGHFKLARLILIVLALVLFWSCHNIFADLAATTKNLKSDTVPSIVAAQTLRATLSDANANLANFMLTHAGDDNLAWKEYQKDMDRVHDVLLLASQNITFGEAERKPILTMLHKLAEYERLVGQTRAKNSLEQLERADELMRTVILPAASELDQVNLDELNKRMMRHRATYDRDYYLTLASGAAVLAMLALTQYWLFRRTRRIVNPGLVIATVVVAGLGLMGRVDLVAIEKNIVTEAHQNAFQSIHALWKARAIANDANADESFFLLAHGDPTRQVQRSADFKQKIGQLVAGDAKLALDHAEEKTPFQGLIGDELANANYKGERELGLTLLTQWVSYLDIDKKIRQLEQAGDNDGAIALNIGRKEGQSNWAFDQFDQTLERTLALNTREFNAAIGQADRLLNHYLMFQVARLVILLLAVFIGMKVRIDEYRF